MRIKVRTTELMGKVGVFYCVELFLFCCVLWCKPYKWFTQHETYQLIHQKMISGHHHKLKFPTPLMVTNLWKRYLRCNLFLIGWYFTWRGEELSWIRNHELTHRIPKGIALCISWNSCHLSLTSKLDYNLLHVWDCYLWWYTCVVYGISRASLPFWFRLTLGLHWLTHILYRTCF